MVAPNSETPQPPSDDPMGPPATPVEVECIHCGSVYMSDQIRWEADPNGAGGGWWVCPIDGCDGAGFCFDIFPTDPKVAEQFGVHSWSADEDGECHDEIENDADEDDRLKEKEEAEDDQPF